MIVMVMGVAGAGKTTVGRLLAKQMGWEFADADNFHSPENVEKIRRGIALTDADRAPWLAAIHQAMLQWSAENRNVVLACSALKGAYRQQLLAGLAAKLVYLRGSRALLYQRLRSRHGHFATETLLASQLATLEEPDDAVAVDIEKTPEEIVTEIRRRLALA